MGVFIYIIGLFGGSLMAHLEIMTWQWLVISIISAICAGLLIHLNDRIKMTKKEKNMLLCGYGMALADAYRLHGDSVLISDVLKNSSMTLEDFEKAGLEDYDLDVIREGMK